MPGGDARRTGAWRRYWEAERLASCGGEGGRPYQPAISGFWTELIDSLPAPVALLDLCCGNGALALLAYRALRRRGAPATVYGVDLAPIDPARWLPAEREDLAAIRFLGGVPAERLPFPPGSFAAVVGQYALEYTDVPRTLAACLRVLAPRATLAFLLHAREGLPAQAAAAQREEIAALRALGYFEAARAVVRAHGGGGDTAARAREGWAVKDASLARLAGMASDPALFSNVAGVVRHALACLGAVPARTVLAKIDEVEEHVLDHEARVTALLAAARSREETRALFASLRDHGFVFVGDAPREIRGPHGLLGWAVRLEREGS